MIHFLLNDRETRVQSRPGRSVLDFLRLDQGLLATKKGCGEGDCGACTILLGGLARGEVRYRSMNACLLPMARLHGRHLVTLEGLQQEGLSPVQRALLDQGGVQCGFCVPGMLMSLTGLLLNRGQGTEPIREVEYLDGNLCRCTGYMGIRRALARLLAEVDKGLSEGESRMKSLVRLRILPPYFADVAVRLKVLHRPNQEQDGDGQVVAGGTDLLLASPQLRASKDLRFVDRHLVESGIFMGEDHCRIGAATSVQELLESPELARRIPHWHRYLTHFGSTPVRDQATVGGNIVSASPIGDLSIMFLALEVQVELLGEHGLRQLPLSSLFTGYRRFNLWPGELVNAVTIPLGQGEVRFHYEKIAHRSHLDVATVNTAIRVHLERGRLNRVVLAAGGIGPTPSLLTHTAEFLQGQAVNRDLVLSAAEWAGAEVAPVNDLRGTRDYKRLLLHQLIVAHFLALFPERLRPEDFAEVWR